LPRHYFNSQEKAFHMTVVQHKFLVVVCFSGCIRCSLAPSLCMYSILSFDLLTLYQYIKRFEDWAPVASTMKPVASACTHRGWALRDDFECDGVPWPRHIKSSSQRRPTPPTKHAGPPHTIHMYKYTHIWNYIPHSEIQ
jgi:hypothetical protein